MPVYTQQGYINGANPVIMGGFGGIKFFPGPQNIVTPSAGPNSGANYVIAPQGNNVSNSQIMRVRAAGTFSFSPLQVSPVFTLNLYSVAITQAPNGSVSMGSPVLITGATEGGSNEQLPTLGWAIGLELVGDSGSGLVQMLSGYFAINGVVTNPINPVASGQPNVVPGLSNVNFANSAPFGLVIGAGFGTNQSGNSTSMFQFSIQNQ